MDKLDVYRQNIDKIDKEMVQLFEERMKNAQNIGEYKQKHNLPVLNAGREKVVIEKAAANLRDKNLAPYVEDFFVNMMRISRKYQADNAQNSKKIAYYGVEGSFTYEAVLQYAKNLPSFETVGCATTEEVFRLLLNDGADMAVIPFENSTTGAVVDVYDLLYKYNFYIAGEMFLKVSQHLMAKKGVKKEDIKTVYSHPQAISQCKKFIEFNGYDAIPYLNTALSAKFVSESERSDVAAIAGASAAKIYNLEILSANINTDLDNYTKFIVLSKKAANDENADKVSAVISVDDKAGMLYNVIKIFKDEDINLTKIESRPDHKNPFEYMFFIDFEGNVNDDRIKNAIEKLKNQTKAFKYLGNYKRRSLQP